MTGLPAVASRRRAWTVLSICILAPACGGLTLPEEEPTVEGTVRAPLVPLLGQSTLDIEITVEGNPCDDLTVRLVQSWPRRTEFVFREADGSLREGGIQDLKTGNLLRAWTDSPIAGCPWSGVADHIEVRDPES